MHIRHISFTSAKENSLKLVMETLATYEEASGQLINKGKKGGRGAGVGGVVFT